MLVFFNLIPLLLLLLYPAKWFQKLLGCFPRVNWLPLHAFMDIFQGCYKNGTEGTRDYRYFSGLYLMLRVLHLIPFDYQTISNIRYIFVPLLFSYAFAVLRPYKRHIYNMCDSLFFFLYALCNWLALSPYFNEHSIVLVYMYALFGMMYVSFFIVINILKTVTPGFYDMCQRKFLRSAHNLALLCKDGDTENIHKLHG